MATPSLQNLTSQLEQLASANKATQLLIDRLANLKFQPGSLAPENEDGDGGDVRVELTAEIHEGLKGQEERLEVLGQEVEELLALGSGYSTGARDTKSNEKARLSILAARLSEDLKNSRAQFRRAQLTAKRSAEAAKAQERALLFANLQSNSSSDPAGISRSGTPNSLHPSSARRQRNPSSTRKTEDEILLSASSDVTAALRRTHHLIQSELSRSQFAQETLERGTEALSQLNESYSSVDDLLSASKGLLSTLVSSQKSDTWYLETAFYILLATLGWLVFRRLLYGPFWLLVFFPLKLGFRIVFGVLATLGITGGRSGPVIASSSGVTVHASLSSGSPASVVIGASRATDVAMPGSDHVEGGTGKDPSVEGSLSQEVGQMVEESRQEGKEPVIRGDGTVLPDRNEGQARNPKKKAFDVGIEEEQAQAHNPKKKTFDVGAEEERVRDEL